MDRNDLLIPTLLSEENAPGLVMAHGNIGSGLKQSARVFVSSNGGLTWKRAPMKGVFKFNILDQGSVMTAMLSAPQASNIIQ